MTDRFVNRRTLLGGSALGLAGGVGVGVEPAAAAVAPMGPWTYVAPGESIQAAINAGARAVQLGDGDYPLTTRIVPTAGCVLRGVGQRTRLRAATAMTEVVAIGNGAPVEAVQLTDLLIDCAGKADNAIDLNIVGTAGNFYGEPDSVCRLNNLWIYAPKQDGVVYRGTDTESCVSSRIRVRLAGRYGFNIVAPGCWWIACEATTTTATGSSAGYFVNGANNFFQSCKAWYSRDYGFHVKGTRNKFVGCEAQDTRSHGWYIEWDRNVFVGCVADSAAFHDVGGAPGGADGFYVVAGGETSMVGCQAFDRRAGGHAVQQRYGFNVPAGMVTGGQLTGYTGWDNLSGLLNRR